jgi:lipopolysaccharide/colanic/teichoic acid biosynthesis glycosyltransferase
VFRVKLEEVNAAMQFVKELSDETTASDGLAAQRYRNSGVKRVFDLVFSIALIFAALPFMVIVAICIYAVDPGPILFGHKRVGANGKTFRCLKFRTMVVDAEDKLDALLANDAEARAEWELSRKLKNDPRILPFVGKILRRTSMDELPQFFNVLVGDMSIIGPRPVTQSELDEHYGANTFYYRMVRPGLSGLWQVSGRSLTTFEERVDLDVEYVSSMSFSNDLKILIKTPIAVVSRAGAC